MTVRKNFRTQNEVDICRKEQPFVIRVARSESTVSIDGNPASPSQFEISTTEDNVIPMETDTAGPSSTDTVNKGASTSADDTVVIPGPAKGMTALHDIFLEIAKLINFQNMTFMFSCDDKFHRPVL